MEFGETGVSPSVAMSLRLGSFLGGGLGLGGLSGGSDSGLGLCDLGLALRGEIGLRLGLGGLLGRARSRLHVGRDNRSESVV